MSRRETIARSDRRQQILESLALMLESSPGARVTTSALANHVGVSEAALYRHFPSKAKMLEGLIEFMEASVFTRVSRILAEEPSALARCRDLLALLLTFAERNPGFARLLAGDALQGETDRLRSRMRQFFDRLETQLRQVLREGAARDEVDVNPAVSANLMLATVEGRINQFVRSEFKLRPTADWNQQWPMLAAGLMRQGVSSVPADSARAMP